MIGTVLGVGAFVAILGLTSTASGQIGRRFTTLTATTVTVVPAESDSDAVPFDHPERFPADADARIEQLNGVTSAGIWWPITASSQRVISARPGVRAGTNEDAGGSGMLYAASPGLLRSIDPTVRGALFNAFHDARGERVCVLGATLAERLGITQLDTRPAVFVDDVAYTVIGILDNVSQAPELLTGITIPRRTAERVYGPPPANDPAKMIIRTRLGAASLIAAQAPTALRPQHPHDFSAVPPPDPHELRDNVEVDLTGLFLVLAGICLIIGMVGIANTTFVAVLERTPEIGLRRALGARARHVAAQFLAESTALGLMGGLVGTAIAVATVLAVAVSKNWTAILDPATVVPAPLIGAGVGLFAGLYPSVRAARIEPQEALRR
ncbi:ABC transporter permease [Streptomyces sp. NPDC046900]|uniref:ABC transporter permease n=1 Tax=Streptomyces sp. NPDC046900 TaxID=3155473 RepID=UPI0033EA1993